MMWMRCCLRRCSDWYGEVKAGILAVKENTSLPVFVTMTFEQNGRTLSGNDPVTFVNTVQGLGADMLGVNCSLGPAELGPIIEEILSVSSVPVMISRMQDFHAWNTGRSHYHVTSDEYAELMQGYLKDGISAAGGGAAERLRNLSGS